MSVEVEISPIFRRYTDNILNMKVEGKTVRECLHDLVRRFPKLKPMLLDKDSNLMHSYDFLSTGKASTPKTCSIRSRPAISLTLFSLSTADKI